MNGFGWRVMAVMARFLEPDEREVVLGDLLEAGESAWGGLSHVLGLVIRRQAALWWNWRPWLAALGVALPGSFFLMGCSVSLSLTCAHLLDARLAASAGPVTNLGLLAGQFLLLLGWSWSGGFVVGAMSRPTIWASLAVSCAPCLFCLSKFRMESLPAGCLLLFLPPAIFGVRQGWRLTRLNPAAAFALAVLVTVLILPVWGARSGDLRVWIFTGGMCFAAWYLAATARKPLKEERKPT